MEENLGGLNHFEEAIGGASRHVGLLEASLRGILSTTFVDYVARVNQEFWNLDKSSRATSNDIAYLRNNLAALAQTTQYYTRQELAQMIVGLKESQLALNRTNEDIVKLSHNFGKAFRDDAPQMAKSFEQLYSHSDKIRAAFDSQSTSMRTMFELYSHGGPQAMAAYNAALGNIRFTDTEPKRLEDRIKQLNKAFDEFKSKVGTGISSALTGDFTSAGNQIGKAVSEHPLLSALSVGGLALGGKAVLHRTGILDTLEKSRAKEDRAAEIEASIEQNKRGLTKVGITQSYTGKGDTAIIGTIQNEIIAKEAQILNLKQQQNNANQQQAKLIQQNINALEKEITALEVISNRQSAINQKVQRESEDRRIGISHAINAGIMAGSLLSYGVESAAGPNSRIGKTAGALGNVLAFTAAGSAIAPGAGTAIGLAAGSTIEIIKAAREKSEDEQKLEEIERRRNQQMGNAILDNKFEEIGISGDKYNKFMKDVKEKRGEFTSGYHLDIGIESFRQSKELQDSIEREKDKYETISKIMKDVSVSGMTGENANVLASTMLQEKGINLSAYGGTNATGASNFLTQYQNKITAKVNTQIRGIDSINTATELATAKTGIEDIKYQRMMNMAPQMINTGEGQAQRLQVLNALTEERAIVEEKINKLIAMRQRGDIGDETYQKGMASAQSQLTNILEKEVKTRISNLEATIKTIEIIKSKNSLEASNARILNGNLRESLDLEVKKGLVTMNNTKEALKAANLLTEQSRINLENAKGEENKQKAQQEYNLNLEKANQLAASHLSALQDMNNAVKQRIELQNNALLSGLGAKQNIFGALSDAEKLQKVGIQIKAINEQIEKTTDVVAKAQKIQELYTLKGEQYLLEERTKRGIDVKQADIEKREKLKTQLSGGELPPIAAAGFAKERMELDIENAKAQLEAFNRIKKELEADRDKKKDLLDKIEAGNAKQEDIDKLLGITVGERAIVDVNEKGNNILNDINGKLDKTITGNQGAPQKAEGVGAQPIQPANLAQVNNEIPRAPQKAEVEEWENKKEQARIECEKAKEELDILKKKEKVETVEEKYARHAKWEEFSPEELSSEISDSSKDKWKIIDTLKEKKEKARKAEEEAQRADEKVSGDREFIRKIEERKETVPQPLYDLLTKSNEDAMKKDAERDIAKKDLEEYESKAKEELVYYKKRIALYIKKREENLNGAWVKPPTLTEKDAARKGVLEKKVQDENKKFVDAESAIKNLETRKKAEGVGAQPIQPANLAQVNNEIPRAPKKAEGVPQENELQEERKEKAKEVLQQDIDNANNAIKIAEATKNRLEGSTNQNPLINALKIQTEILRSQNDIYNARIGLMSKLHFAGMAFYEIGQAQIQNLQETLKLEREKYEVMKKSGMFSVEDLRTQKLAVMNAQMKIADAIDFQRRSVAEMFLEKQMNIAQGSVLNPTKIGGYASGMGGYTTGWSQFGEKYRGTYSQQVNNLLGHTGGSERSYMEQMIHMLGNDGVKFKEGQTFKLSLNNELFGEIFNQAGDRK